VINYYNINLKKIKENMVIKKNSYQILRYDKRHYNQFVELFQNSIEKYKTKSYFSYNLSPTPYGSSIRVLMKYNGQIVGSHSIRPLLISVNNKEVLGGLTYNTMTHPEHRNKGIFTALATKTHEVAKRKKFKIILGFSNPASIYGYTRKLGHKELGPINFLKINKIGFDSQQLPIIRKHWFPKNLDNIIQSFQNKLRYSIMIKKNSKYVKWKYQKNPETFYYTCYKENEYFFILKEYENSVHVIDYFCTEPNFLKILLTTALKFSKKRSKMLTMWIPTNHYLMQLINKGDYEIMKQQQFFHITCFDKKLKSSVLNFKNWFYTMGDSDVF